MNRIELTAAATVFLATAGAFPLTAQDPQEPQPSPSAILTSLDGHVW